MEEMQPGQVITPRGSVEPSGPDGAPNPDRGPTGPPEPTPSPVPPPEPVSPPSTAVTAPAAAAPAVAASPVNAQPPVAATAPNAAQQPGWHAQQTFGASTPQPPLDQAITWTASEFISNEKGTGWYAILFAGSAVLAALVYFLTKDKISTGVVVLAALAFANFAGHQPRTQQYGISRDGVQIGMKLYNFQDFKTFSVIEEGAIASIVFMPLKRFMPPLTIYVAPDMEDQVVDYLGAFLPFEQRRADAIDNLLRRIGF